MCSFSVATSESWQKDGETKKKTEWHNIVVWGKLGSICAEYIKKGSEVYVEGKIETRSYEDKQGVKKYITQIKANNVQFATKKQTEQPNEFDQTQDFPFSENYESEISF